VVADRVADDLPGGAHDQRELGLRYVPGRVATRADQVVRAAHASRRRLEEQLRPARLVDHVVEVVPARLLVAGGARGLVRPARAPPLLAWERAAPDRARRDLARRLPARERAGGEQLVDRRSVREQLGRAGFHGTAREALALRRADP